MQQNQASNQAFLTFSQVSFISFPSSAFSDSLQLCLTSSSGKIHGKKFWGPNGPKLVPKLVFLPFSQVWFFNFPLNCLRLQLGTMSNYQQKYYLQKKKIRGPKLGQTGQNRVQNQGFSHFLKVASLVLFDIAEDCSLEQCLTSGGTENKKKFVEAEMIFSIMLLSVHSNLLVFFLIGKAQFL